MIDLLETFRIRFGGRPLLLLAIVAALLWVGRSQFRASFERSMSTARWTMAIAGALGIVGYISSALWYATDPHFFDNAEPTMVSVGWLFQAGRPIYHGLDAPERYALIYGPLAYVFHGTTLAIFGPRIVVAKLLGAIAGVASVALTYAVARRHETAARAAALAGLYAVVLLLFRHYSFWTRPEPFQLCAAAASLLFAVRGRGTGAAIAVGVASGVLWNLKFTGPLYSLPLFALLHHRMGWRGTSTAAAIAVVVAALPFVAFTNVSLKDYLLWVQLSTHTGLLLSTLRQNLEWCGFLALPILISHFGAVGDRLRDPGYRDAIVALMAGMIGVAVAGAKPGAGPYHFLPFLPPIAYLVARNTSRMPSAAAIDAVVPRALMAFVAVCVMLAIVQQTQFITTMAKRRSVHEAADIEAFARSHDGVIEMGYGATEAASLARPILTFRNDSYLLDQPAIREHQLAGIEIPPATTEAVASCRVNYWLVPKGEAPFSGVNGYAAVLLHPLYPESFRRAFLSTHARIGETAYYDVWQCRAGAAK